MPASFRPRLSRLFSVACLGVAMGSVLLAASDPAIGAERNPVRVVPQAAESTQSARVIVKYRDRARALSAATSTGSAGFPHGATELSTRLRVELKDGRGLGPRTQVLFAKGLSSSDLAARLSQEADVEWAVVDGRKYPLFVPNDPLFPANADGHPAVGQWYLRTPGAPDNLEGVSAIDAESAWDISQGATDFAIADIDSGITAHPDLQNQIYYSGTVPYGYDFVGYALESGESAADAVLTANDGDQADPDPSDPGDWITAQEDSGAVDGGFFKGCVEDPTQTFQNSSWHGTQTAGVLAAQTNNGIGTAGVVPNGHVVPVRVLGKCGGYDSDILAGMQWAAGIAVEGVPANLHPSRVLNMSLGGSGACGSDYQDVFDQLTAMNVVVVVAAGNDEGLAVGTPANCIGAVSVAGLRNAGDKVGFSDLGPNVTLGAPAGNCVNQVGLCLFPIATTTNSGTTSPAAATYSDDGADPSLGTSFSTPMVTGTVALMLSVAPNLTQPQIVQFLKNTATPYPTTGGSPGTPVCLPPSGQTQDECYCTTTTCGAGMLNTHAAVAAAAASAVTTAVITESAGPAVVVGAALAVNGADSVATPGQTLSSYTWSILSGDSSATLSGTTGPTVSLTGVAAGSVSLQLTVADSAGATSSATQTVIVSAEGTGGGGGTGGGSGGGSGGGGGAANPAWLLALLLAGALLAPRRRSTAVRATPATEDR